MDNIKSIKKRAIATDSRTANVNSAHQLWPWHKEGWDDGSMYNVSELAQEKQEPLVEERSVETNSSCRKLDKISHILQQVTIDYEKK